ncbi:MAG: zinc-binding alcohol dehydrogenase family protein [Salinivenus sp.]
MKAFFIDAPGETSLGLVDEPTPAADEVRLRVRTVGFCGTDLSTFQGKNPLVSYPRIPGHEIGASIEATGAAVPDRFQKGADVTVLPYTNCGECSACRQERPNCCRKNETLGVQRHGALAEVITVPWQKIVPASQRSLRELALVEPLTIGFHAVQRGEMAARDTVVVLGCGTIGLGVVAGAVRQGAEVIGVDLYDWKLDLARTIGAEHTVNTDSHSLSDRLRAITDGEGPAVIVEAIGQPETFRAAVDEVAFGGRVVYLGYVGEPVTYDPTPFVKKELDIRGSRNARRDDFRDVIDFLGEGSFPVDRMITRTVEMESAGRALKKWRDHPQNITKIQVAVQS